MKMRKLLCASLSLVLMSGLLAAGATGETPEIPVTPSDNTLAIPLNGVAAAGEDDTDPSYTRTLAMPFLVYGKATIVDARILLENSNENDPFQKISLTTNEDTMVLDAVTGARLTLADIKDQSTVYAYAGPIVGRSLPPTAYASLILCNAPSDIGVPTYAEVEQVMTGEDGKVSLLMTGAVVLHLNADTQLMTYGTKNVVTLEDITPGTRLLSWYSVVALSYPGQATPSKVMVFPSDYDGLLSMKTSGADLTINGTALTLSQTEAPRMEGETLMLPLRKVAEALGATVTWNVADNHVDVSLDDVVLYSFVIGESTVTVGEDSSSLATALTAQEGVAFMPAADLIRLHNLKVVG